jgi:TPR repeat protein
LSISSSDELMRSILRRLTPEQKAAMQEVAKAAGSRTSLGQPVRAPVIDLSQITSASTALFDVAYMEPRASYRATSDTSYIGAAYDMALAYAEGAGVKQDANRARSHMHLADREGIRPLPASGTGGSAVLKGPGGVDLFAAARYGSTVAANLYANELLKQGKSTPAIEWLRAAALKTHYNSRSTLASYVLIEGDLRAGTIEEAFRWLEAGARAGQPNSVGLLGYAILHGLGVEPDPTAARPYLEAGARLGSQSTKKILDSLNAWEKDRAAAWDAIAQASKQSNEIFDRVGKATAKYAQDLRAANESLGIGKEASGDAAALARTRAELKAKGMTEAQIDAHLAQVNKDLAPAQTARPPGPPASPPAEPPKR